MRSDERHQPTADTTPEEDNLEWLLDLDLQEPENHLFRFSSPDTLDRSLNKYEAEMANRPMVRGHDGFDLSNYVEEEIVFSDINGGEVYVAEVPSGNIDEELADSMTIENWHHNSGYSNTLPDVDMPDDTDILELKDEDDISNYRLKRRPKKQNLQLVETSETPPTENDNDLEGAEVFSSLSDDLNNSGAEFETPYEFLDTDQLLPPIAADQASDLDLSLDLPEQQRATWNDIEDPVAAEQSPAQDNTATDIETLALVDDLDQTDAEDALIVSDNSIAEADQTEEITLELPASDDDESNDIETSFDLNADDQSFDQFLTETEMPEPSAEELEDFSIEPTPGVTATDAELDDNLDYHEDLRALEGFEHSEIIPQTEHLDTLRNALREQALAAAPVGTDIEIKLRIGSDDETRESCASQGFIPLTTLPLHLANASANIAAQTRQATFVRCSIAGDERAQNQWLTGANKPVEYSSSTADIEPEDSIFDDDLFDIDVSDEVAEQEFLTEQAIEEMLNSLSNESSEDGAICGVELHEFQGANVTEAHLYNTPTTEANADSITDDEHWYLPAGIDFATTSGDDSDIFDEFLDVFIDEGSDELEQIEDTIGEWELDINDDSRSAQVSRNLHTLKGIAKGVGLQRYGTLIHNFETLLEQMQRPDQANTKPYFRVINLWLDSIVRGFQHISDSRTDIANCLPSLGQEDVAQSESTQADSANDPHYPVSEDGTDDIVTDESSTPEEIPAANTSVSSALANEREKRRDRQLADEGAKALAAQQSVRITSEKLDELLNLTNQAQQLGVRAAQTLQRCKRGSMELQSTLVSVRTHTARVSSNATRTTSDWNRGSRRDHLELDALEMDQYTELQEAANILREGIEDLTDLVTLTSRHQTQVETLLKQQSNVMSSISSSVQAARVVPVSRLMPGLRRIVRTVSNELGKTIAFKVLNEAGALDRDNYARCQTILEHMVRNALDHGIEMPDDRLDAGKANTGVISIDVRKEGADYIIALEDDGRGIDPDKMRDAAYEKGLDIDVDELTDEQALRMVFHKGFSTASRVSEISGRGVGMDVVLNELQKMGGDIDIHSDVGKGTRFEIRIPSNVTVNGALMVSAGEHSYAIPLDGLVAVEHIPAAEFFTAIEQGKLLQIYDMACEPSYLATLCYQDPMPARTLWGHTIPIIVAGTAERYLAVAVDDVQEALELAIRSLGPNFAGVTGLAGGATTADGAAIIALDLNTMVAHLPDNGTYGQSGDHEQRPLILVVDDSRTQRMVSTSHFDTVGVETVTAENGIAAIDLLNNTHRLPSAILLDVEMPLKDGIQTLREIRQSSRYGHLPVIMVTSRTGAKHKALAEEAGCNGYMGKPFNFPLLVEQINTLTGLSLTTQA